MLQAMIIHHSLPGRPRLQCIVFKPNDHVPQESRTKHGLLGAFQLHLCGPSRWNSPFIVLWRLCMGSVRVVTLSGMYPGFLLFRAGYVLGSALRPCISSNSRSRHISACRPNHHQRGSFWSHAHSTMSNKTSLQSVAGGLQPRQGD